MAGQEEPWQELEVLVCGAWKAAPLSVSIITCRSIKVSRWLLHKSAWAGTTALKAPACFESRRRRTHVIIFWMRSTSNAIHLDFKSSTGAAGVIFQLLMEAVPNRIKDVFEVCIK